MSNYYALLTLCVSAHSYLFSQANLLAFLFCFVLTDLKGIMRTNSRSHTDLTSRSVTLNKLFNLTGPQYLHLKSRFLNNCWWSTRTYYNKMVVIIIKMDYSDFLASSGHWQRLLYVSWRYKVIILAYISFLCQIKTYLPPLMGELWVTGKEKESISYEELPQLEAFFMIKG